METALGLKVVKGLLGFEVVSLDFYIDFRSKL